MASVLEPQFQCKWIIGGRRYIFCALVLFFYTWPVKFFRVGVERRRVASRISAKKVMSAGFHRIHPLDFVSGARSGGALCGR